jgi:hypothetical protein
VEPLKDIVSCVARAKINLSHGGWGVVGKIHALTVNRDQPITLKCRPVLLLKIGMLYDAPCATERTWSGRPSSGGVSARPRRDILQDEDIK